MRSILDAVLAVSGGIIGFLFGNLDGLFYALVAFVVLDYISGVIVAFINKKLSSEIGFRGICKKVLLFLVVALANIIDVQIIGGSSVLRTGAIFVFLANEGLSMLENTSAMGLPVPQAIKNALAQLRKKSGDSDTEK